MHSSTERDPGSCRFRSSDRPRRQRLLVAGMALVAVGCAQTHDLPTERCLEVLAYRSPAHGKIGEIRTAEASAGRTVTIEYAGADGSGSEAPQSIACEYGAEEHWTATGITIGGRELTERELALVNSELLLRDLSLRPQRFEEWQAEPESPQPDTPPPTLVGSAPPNPRLSAETSNAFE